MDKDVTADEAPESTLWTFWLGCFFGIVLYFPAHLLATIVHALLLRDGIPLGPFIALPIGATFMGLVTIVEERVQKAKTWSRIKDAWYRIPLVFVTALPVALVVFFPKPVAVGLPGVVSVPIAAALAFVPAALAIRRAARKLRRTPLRVPNVDLSRSVPATLANLRSQVNPDNSGRRGDRPS